VTLYVIKAKISRYCADPGKRVYGKIHNEMKEFIVEDELTSEEKQRCHEKSLIYIDAKTGDRYCFAQKPNVDAKYTTLKCEDFKKKKIMMIAQRHASI